MSKFLIFSRRLVSLGVLVIFFFGANSFAGTVYAKLNVLQIGPLFLRALVEGSLTALSFFGLMMLSTLVFGRWYCSFLCPLGIFQDLIMGIRNFFKPYKFKFASGKKLRLLTFLVVFILLFGGIIMPLSFLDPFSIFTRFTATTVFPLINAVKTHVLNIIPLNIVIAVSEILIISLLVIYKGRLFCNSFCPVGALLGEVSQKPLFGISINDNCVHCGACEKNCKAEAIKQKDKFVDSSKCVMCFNCLGQCKFNAISYTRLNQPNPNKRKFLIGILAFAAGAALSNRLIYNKRKFVKETLPAPLPPGVRSLEKIGRAHV